MDVVIVVVVVVDDDDDDVMKVSATNADRRDVERMYNRRTISELQHLAPFVSNHHIQSSVLLAPLNLFHEYLYFTK